MRKPYCMDEDKAHRTLQDFVEQMAVGIAHEVVDGDHAHEAREHTQNQGNVHQGLPGPEPQPGIHIRHHQRQHGGDDAADARHEQRVQKPTGKIEQRRIRKQAHVVLQRQDARPQIGRKCALFAPEGGQDQPEHRHHPKNGKHGKKRVQGNGDPQLAQVLSAPRRAVDAGRFSLHWKVSSFFTAPVWLYTVRDRVETIMKMKMPMVEASA